MTHFIVFFFEIIILLIRAIKQNHYKSIFMLNSKKKGALGMFSSYVALGFGLRHSRRCYAFKVRLIIYEKLEKCR